MEPVDVLIAGAGPVGLALANLLGGYGRSVVVVEARDELIDYPRGVGLDDESFRTVQAMGLVSEVSRHTVPHHIVRLVNGRGRVLVTNDPAGEPLGWPRKHGFIQPLVDRELLGGLARFDHVDVLFGHELTGLADDGGLVTATVRTEAGTREITARYVVGCEGGRSFARGWMGVEFEGRSPSTRWLVVDVDHDPLGTPNVYLGADPRRPYVSIGLPHGIRRWEFMLRDDEPTERVTDPAFLARLLRDHVPDPSALDVIGHRVFTHHGRIASAFRKGRVLLAGDAAHLMPVWLGQGWNSGIRDAANLAWKLAAVLRGLSDDALLDTYDSERRAHAKAMIDLNMTAGSIMKCGRAAGAVRDVVAGALNAVPSVKGYFTDMRFKPVPRYRSGVVVDQSSRTPGTAAAKVLRGLAPMVDAPDRSSPVGLQFPQPWVRTADLGDVRLDDVLGDWWALAAWGNDPARWLGEEERAMAAAFGMRLVCFTSETQRAWTELAYPGVTVVGDVRGELKRWFDARATGAVFLRPDRFVAAACLTQEAGPTLRAVLAAARFRRAG
ncbi:bifunctional 3-(3-hydroxy-phenyl)propionate/3-hydroxycinnamic acid hydroxylase [Actinocorallia sp. A-T 12471]|uniref:bifunctional 3-(3-hydroxy-phenyl)propionate/3-hydroxycinnamic acid hydroxylase MhpA n=1 Tax=Actinocorallia sp. A-T 12471 TaxID=3089813 RepID=UPI0029D1920E|nr:bifunctional 3-(3-hydroxy-phenyl)propionate/3-hydroxycinnamic acid hydroxylase [Actinocorallia sp. A-T 12471]MDX6740644.1 bifunctional 3-(3-hydroxy-phenyl)propionate/3-hydroxycinnamic acid hydroxylase [Actinocorallia sp. A-T 12471]